MRAQKKLIAHVWKKHTHADTQRQPRTVPTDTRDIHYSLLCSEQKYLLSFFGQNTFFICVFAHAVIYASRNFYQRNITFRRKLFGIEGSIREYLNFSTVRSQKTQSANSFSDDIHTASLVPGIGIQWKLPSFTTALVLRNIR